MKKFKVMKKTSTGEFVVVVTENGKRLEEECYYADNRLDATRTMHHMESVYAQDELKKKCNSADNKILDLFVKDLNTPTTCDHRLPILNDLRVLDIVLREDILQGMNELFHALRQTMSFDECLKSKELLKLSADRISMQKTIATLPSDGRVFTMMCSEMRKRRDTKSLARLDTCSAGVIQHHIASARSQVSEGIRWSTVITIECNAFAESKGE